MNSKVLEALLIPDNMYIHNKKLSLYHISPNGSLKELTPRYSMKPIKGEDNSIKRISATPTIDGCFRGVGYNLNPGDKPIKFYIYKLLLSDSTKVIKPTTKMVPDRDLCDEYWVLNPVKVKSLGYITISLDPKTNKYQFDDSKVTESLSYDNKSISLEGLFDISSKDISDAQVQRSPYYKMSDRELATRMVDRLYNNLTIELAPKSDPSVAKPLQLMRLIAYDYYEYNINGIPVAVARANASTTKEPSFTVYAYIPKNNQVARAISSTKSDLIRSFIEEDNKRSQRR